MPLHDGLSQRDREEIADAAITRYVANEIGALELRAELVRAGFNATQIREYALDAQRQVLANFQRTGKLS